MMIGDEVYVHGIVDEIRRDVVIIRNAGGYFGTDKGELVSGELRTKQDVIQAYDKVLEFIDSTEEALRPFDHEKAGMAAILEDLRAAVERMRRGELE